MYGAERVSALVRLQETAISHLERLIEEHRIDCDYEPVGNVIAAVHPRQHANLDLAAETAARYGVPGEMLDAHEMERRGLPRAFTRGWFEPHGGILDPARYVAGRFAALRWMRAFGSTSTRRWCASMKAPPWSRSRRARSCARGLS